jgi:hypothetical protein
MKLIITGKPDIGKTTIAHIMEREFTKELVVGVDAIDIMKTTSMPTPVSAYARKCYQQVLYHLQVALENITTDKHPNRLILCDHGTLDCLALWPETPQSFFKEIHSSFEEELARYDWVLQINGTEQSQENPLTMQPPLDPQHFWRLHSRFLAIPSEKGFSFCYRETARVIQDILKGLSYKEVRENLHRSLEQGAKGLPPSHSSSPPNSQETLQ